MFDIPELDDLIYRQLEQHDLFQCVQVNKKWHNIVIPFLWREISPKSPHSKAAFYKLVAEDYHYDRRVQHEKHSVGQRRPIPSPFSSPLTKHGRWIRKTLEPENLLSCLRCCGGTLPLAAPEELLRHFYRKCHVIEARSIELSPQCFTSSLWRTITEDVTIHVQYLWIGNPRNATKIHSWKLKYLLDRLSLTLEDLTLEINIEHAESEDKETEIKEWTKLRHLELMDYVGDLGTGSFWKWLWKKCGRVERLSLSSAAKTDTQILCKAMLTHMPNLDKIQIQLYHIVPEEINDKQMAMLLSCTRNGWKEVEINDNQTFSRASWKVLTTHFSTLEELIVDGTHRIRGKDLVQVLRSCPNLRVLVAIDNRAYSPDVDFTQVKAGSFIDQNPTTGKLIPWACETSLKVLKIRINDILRPDLSWMCEDPEMRCDQGQGREIQHKVFERIGRLTKLETLWLGHDPDRLNCRLPRHYQYPQLDCLEVTIRGGLEKLSGLKEMRELGVAGMAKETFYPEVFWMVLQWPKLERIYGFDRTIMRDSMTVKVMEERFPEIHAPDINQFYECEDDDENE
ncbi:hypothetical protein B0O80DRAFT_448492 [Mortierella sp. GBAus27b]|nr:hypothetical protein BGX31_011021 [Mortierella sp. GBA43]KAI8356004.1 hypothetical protein B0O80DRAFT_448492 [Mortierella sp. GBAus27b]